MRTYPLAPSPGRGSRARLSVEQLAAAAGLHPDLVRRLVALGLLDAPARPAPLDFAPEQAAVAARIVRLQVGLSLNYAALGLVLELLSRVEELEAAAQAVPAASRGVSWATPAG